MNIIKYIAIKAAILTIAAYTVNLLMNRKNAQQ